MVKIPLSFATSNPNKFSEAQSILSPYKIRLQHINRSYPEIRADDVEEVALASAELVFSEVKKPLIVEDTGLFIKSLNGFPGPYSALAQKKLGNRGILKLLEGASDRSAYFKTCVAFADQKGARAFCGEVHGSISLSENGKDGFGYDPLFVPEGHNETFAENETLKNQISHRFNAFTAFARWYANYSTQKAEP